MGRKAGVKNRTTNDGLRSGGVCKRGRLPGLTWDGSPHVDTVVAQAGGFGLSLCPGRGVHFGDTTGSIVPPIYTSSTFARDPDKYEPR